MPDRAKGRVAVEKIWVSDLKTGERIYSVFQVTSISLREYDKGKFLSLRLGDRTGKVSAVQWDHAEESFHAIQEGDLVEIDGRVGIYQEETQIKIASLHPVKEPQMYPASDFLPSSPILVQDMIREFDELVAQVQDADYKRVLDVFRQHPSLWDAFSKAPGAKRWHHPYLHGLLEHTLCVMKLSRQIAPFYPEVNGDLLLTGALFHDCGKLEEYCYDTKIDFSTDGRLMGHIYQGSWIVDRLLASLPDFPAEKRRQLLHMILSHHGEIERSPILPMTLEACLLHHIENMDAQMAALRREISNVEPEKRNWTGYIKLLDRSLYLGENETPGENTLDE